MSKDTRYVFGTVCTWHEEIAQTNSSDAIPLCPHCKQLLHVLPSCGDFWDQVRKADSVQSGYEPMMRWGQGKCFPDLDTLENAYRQAMEGHQ